MDASRENKLEERFGKHAAFSKALLDAFALVNSDGVIVKCNSMLGQLVGAKPKQLLKSGALDPYVTMSYMGKPISLSHLKDFPDLKRFEPVIGNVVGGDTLVLIFGVHHFYDEKNYLGSFVVVRDVTAESLLEGKYQDRVLESLTDALTSVNNRNFLNQKLKELTSSSTEELPQNYSMAMLDIDFFKKINDKFGHDAGDFTLKKLGEILRKTMRMTDLIFRYGGEEFCLFLPDTPISGAKIACENLRVKVQDTKFDYKGEVIPVNISLGVTQWQIGSEDPSQALARADAALYESKQNGRNRVTVHNNDEIDQPKQSA